MGFFLSANATFLNNLTTSMTSFVLIGTVSGLIWRFYLWLLDRGKVHSKRYEKNKKIEELIEQHSNNTCLAQDDIKLLTETVNTLAMSQKETIDHNRRQDAQIRHSLEEREVLMCVLDSILDWQLDNGANGSTKEAKKRIADYNRMVSHKFDHYDDRKEI